MVGTRNFQNLLLSWSLVTLYTGALTNPVIRFEPEQTVYIVGERLIVRCLANNPTTVSGYIFNKDALTILNTTANILTFSNLKTSDSGLYFCNYYIENENNPFISNFIQLVVIEQPPAPTLLLMPERTLYVKDQSVVLRCELSIGQSSVVTGITLYQNNREIYDADHFGVLNYTNLQIKNTGRYSCDYTANLTRRIIRSHLSNTVNLFVVEQPPPPTLLVMPQRISFVKDQSVVLRCQLPIGQSSVVTGITLYHNNRQTYDSDDFGVLNYQKLQIKNTGNYSCDYTSNLTGGIVRSHLSNTVTLIVVELPPTPRLRFAYSNQNKTQQVELACEVQNPSFLQINGYRFYRNGKEIESRPANSFIFNHTLNFAGCYWCRTFVTISGEEIQSPKSPEQFLPVDGQAEGQCQETMHSAHILSAQGLKFYGSIIVGKLLVLISVLSIFGVYSLIIQQRKKAAAESQ